MTHSVCEECGSLIPAKVVTDGEDVHFRKFCATHGESGTLVRRDVTDYLRTLRYVKPAWRPDAFEGDAGASCPDGCGFCGRHEQHLCMPIVEVTSRCDLACPICINASGNGRGWDMTVEELRHVLDKIVQAERQVDVLNLSGGEPLLHPRLLDLVDEALSREEIVRVSVSTNGLRLLDEPKLLDELCARDVVVSLQFDGFDDGIYRSLRGRALLRQKQAVLAMLAERDATTSLTMTTARPVNDDQFAKMLELLFGSDHIVSLMIQPMAFVGRASSMDGRAERLTIPDVVRQLGEVGHPAVQAEDFVPLPCSHPLCFSLAFYLMLDAGGAVSLNRLTDAATLMDSLSNRVVFGLDADESDRLKQMIYDLWSGPAGAVPESEEVLATLRSILKEMSSGSSCACFDPKKAFTIAERKVKSIFIHAFQDRQTFDLSRARRCCQAYPQPDGRVIPACVHNCLRRPVS